MVSLWGSKDGGDHSHSGTATPPDAESTEGGGGGGGGYSRSRQQREADERTRLIPPYSGYLDPDDPQVSRRSSLSPLHPQAIAHVAGQ